MLQLFDSHFPPCHLDRQVSVESTSIITPTEAGDVSEQVLEVGPALSVRAELLVWRSELHNESYRPRSDSSGKLTPNFPMSYQAIIEYGNAEALSDEDSKTKSSFRRTHANM